MLLRAGPQEAEEEQALKAVCGVQWGSAGIRAFCILIPLNSVLYRLSDNFVDHQSCDRLVSHFAELARFVSKSDLIMRYVAAALLCAMGG